MNNLAVVLMQLRFILREFDLDYYAIAKLTVAIMEMRQMVTTASLAYLSKSKKIYNQQVKYWTRYGIKVFLC